MTEDEYSSEEEEELEPDPLYDDGLEDFFSQYSEELLDLWEHLSEYRDSTAPTGFCRWMSFTDLVDFMYSPPPNQTSTTQGSEHSMETLEILYRHSPLARRYVRPEMWNLFCASKSNNYVS